MFGGTPVLHTFLKNKFLLVAALHLSLASFFAACSKEEAQDPVEEGNAAEEESTDVDADIADASETEAVVDENEQRISADEDVVSSDTAATELDAPEAPAEVASETSPLLDSVDQTENNDSIASENLASKDEAPASDLKNEEIAADEAVSNPDQDNTELESIVEETTAQDAPVQALEEIVEPAMSEPKAEEPPQMAADNSDKGEYVVRPGDTLAKIARAIYGSARKWNALMEANQLTDANKIFPGDVIYFPKDQASNSFSAAYQREARKSIVVKKNDTLYKIAQKLFGDGKYWKYLWSFNKETLPDPNVLEVGNKLRYMDVKFSSKFAKKFSEPATQPVQTTH